MNKTLMMTTYNLNIPHLNINLESSKPADLYIPGTIRILINGKNHEKKVDQYNLLIYLDERDNTLNFKKFRDEDYTKEEIEICDYLKESFNKLKSSNVAYGNIGKQVVDDRESIIYEPTQNIFVSDFFKFLKVEKRNQIINSVIK